MIDAPTPKPSPDLQTLEDFGEAHQCPYCQRIVYDLPQHDSGLRHHMDNVCPRRPEPESEEE